MQAQLNESVRVLAEFHIDGVLTGGLSPAPTIDVVTPAGSIVVNDGAMTEQAGAVRYIYDYVPTLAGVYQFRISCAAANLDDPYQLLAIEVGQTWLERLDAAISSRSTLTAAVTWGYVISNDKTAEQIVRGFIAALLGKVSGAGGTTVRFRNMADDTNVITATVDSVGNRSVVTLDLDE